MSNSEEEEIARNYLCFGNHDSAIVVVDATCLERNLNLVFQIMEITKNVILCVNLLDEAKKKKIKIDLEKLSNELGIPVVGTTARKKKTLENLLSTLDKVCRKEIIPNPKIVKYPDNLENAIIKLTDVLKSEFKLPSYTYRFLALKILDGNEKILLSIEENFSISILGNEKITHFKKEILKEENLNKKDLKSIITSSIVNRAESVAKDVCTFENPDYSKRDRKIDKILTSKIFGFPIMIIFLGIIFWITIVGANYPSQLLLNFFAMIQEKLIYFLTYINCPTWLSDMLVLGIFQTLTWIVSVMLPPMAIFFPLFTFLEDLGYLPRIAFNMDGFFKKCSCTGKQMITMCMGFGCNAAGVTGCRIIDSPREKLIAILTNSFVPCNGRFPFLISIATIFIAGAVSRI